MKSPDEKPDKKPDKPEKKPDINDIRRSVLPFKVAGGKD